MNLHVIGHTLFLNGRRYRCAVGKGGFAAPDAKREGDGCTPQGRFAMRECWARTDRLAMPQTLLPKRVISPSDGWCDDVNSPLYNRHISLPFDGRHEKLFRDDHVYDLIVPLGYNDNPVVAGLGSAIFMHLAKPDYAPTEGCVALALPDLLEILPHLSTDSVIEIRAE